MHSQLPKFCAEFDALVRPLLQPFGQAVAALEQATQGTPGRELRPGLSELRHHLSVLCTKVAEQHAYVLIFGPLKSGKSTLMNAVAAAYVSEVSSLPAYPCLVFVQAGKEREYVLTRYDGQQQTWKDPSALQAHISAAHSALAQAIRSAEAAGAPFDPQEHFPQAIRRVDVKVPAAELEESGAVLVDTPGLYTRMRFGYDRMTRDFRDAAACAVFVVRSDTLFLEQVFTEFNQLLALWSRIFLVVNVDTNKRDLGPDGTLVPSLEQSRPELILAAFAELAMSEPLQRAHKEGRVRIYAVDLMQAASMVLKGAPASELPRAWVTFKNDLHEYLASSEYLNAFLRDSLQRARGLLREARGLCRSEPAEQLRRALAQNESALGDVRAEQERLRQALQQDLAPAFVRFEQALELEAQRAARDEGAKLLRTLGASIDTWFLSSHSLDWLLGSQWTPLLRDYRQSVSEVMRRSFDQAQAQQDAGLDLPPQVAALCDAAGIDVTAIRHKALQSLGEVQWQGPASVPVDIDTVPIKRGVMDVVAFRSTDKVRERMFGPASKPERKVPAKEKAARLGEPGRLFFHQQVTAFRAELAPLTAASVVAHFGAQLQAKTIAGIATSLRTREPELQAQAERLGREAARLRATLEPLLQLEQITAGVEPQVPALGSRFGAALPAGEPPAILQPMPRQTPAAEPEPTRGTRRSERR